MCLHIDKRYHPRKKPLIAKKDIPVWKYVIPIAPAKYNSFFWNFTYERGYEYSIINKKPFGIIGWVIDRGFHSYNHRNNINYHWIRFYIPKGSLYYIGQYGDIVSNRIVLY